MPAPYDLDLREKAIAAVERGERKSDVARVFDISRNTLDLWLKRKAETGSPAANTDYPRGTRPTIADLDEFRAFVKANGHLTQKQMVERWPQSVSASAFTRAIRKIGCTRKKRLTCIENGMKG